VHARCALQGRGGTLNRPLVGGDGVRRRTGSPPESVDAYFAHVPSQFRSLLDGLRRTVRAAAPRAEERISYGMPAYRQDGMLVYFAAFSDHCSFFVGSRTVRERFSRELKSFEAGKGTLHFTPEHPLPLGLVRRIVAARLAENAARTRGKPRAANRARRPSRTRAR